MRQRSAGDLRAIPRRRCPGDVSRQHSHWRSTYAHAHVGVASSILTAGPASTPCTPSTWVDMRASHFAPSHPREPTHGGGRLTSYASARAVSSISVTLPFTGRSSIQYGSSPPLRCERFTVHLAALAPAVEAAAGTKPQPCRSSSGAHSSPSQRSAPLARFAGHLDRSTSRAPYGPLCAFTNGVRPHACEPSAAHEQSTRVPSSSAGI